MVVHTSNLIRLDVETGFSVNFMLARVTCETWSQMQASKQHNKKRPMTGNVINLTDYKEKNERLKVKSNLETKFQHSLK